MKFFDPKEEVLDVQLTPEGKRLLAQGRFRPEYYSFFDDDVLYDTRFAGFSEPQNESLPRIREDTPYIKVQYNKDGVEASFKKLREQRLFQRDVSNETLNRNDGRLPIGTSNGNKYAPAWNIKLAEGEILNVEQYYSGSWGYSNIPQLSASMEVVTHVEFDEERVQGSLDVSSAGVQGRPLSNPDAAGRNGPSIEEMTERTYDDGSYLVTTQPSILIDISEMNNSFDNENFEIEVYEVLNESSGVGAGLETREILRPLWYIESKEYAQESEDTLTEDAEFPDVNYSSHYVHVHVDGELDSDALDKLFGRKKIGLPDQSPYGLGVDVEDDEQKETC